MKHMRDESFVTLQLLMEALIKPAAGGYSSAALTEKKQAQLAKEPSENVREN